MRRGGEEGRRGHEKRRGGGEEERREHMHLSVFFSMHHPVSGQCFIM